MLIMLIKKKTDDVSECDITNIKMRQYPSDADSETYKLKIVLFENRQPEEFLALMKNFKSAIDRTGNTSAAGKINYIRTLLCGESI